MANYADGARTPRTLTEREQRLLLKVTGELVVGGRLLDARGRPVEIVEVTRRQGVFRVYNFEVAGLHTYFVTRLGVWSHNKNGGCPPGSGSDAPDKPLRGTHNPKVKEAAERGQEAHRNYRNAVGGRADTEVTLPSGRRADAVDWKNRTVRELKPDNPRAVQRGKQQVEKYREELEDLTGEEWTGVVDTYNP